MKFHCRRRKTGPSWACFLAGSRAVRTDLDLRLNATSLLLIPAPLRCEGAPNHCFTYESSFTYTFKMMASRACNVCFCGTQLNNSVVICIMHCNYLICKPSKKYVKEFFLCNKVFECNRAASLWLKWEMSLKAWISLPLCLHVLNESCICLLSETDFWLRFGA